MCLNLFKFYCLFLLMFFPLLAQLDESQTLLEQKVKELVQIKGIYFREIIGVVLYFVFVYR